MKHAAQLAAAGLFRERPPRYTSYPTAPNFSGGVGPDTFADWLGRAGGSGPVSVYLHVPFCRRLCWFCACRTQGTRTDAPVAAYVEALKAEIAHASEVAGRPRLSRLHWGGGTPTILAPELIASLARAIRRGFPFAEGAEFSVEIDPNEIDGPRIAALREAGMTRASIGIQDFDPKIQEAIGRPQSFRVTAEAAAALRRAGIESLNADLVYGLPGQNVASLRRTLRRLLWLRPDRIALYGYAHAPHLAKRQAMIREEDLPGAPLRFDLAEAAREILVSAGYDPVGIDHFALPADGLARAAREGRLKRNFQGYTDDGAAALIGLGASSISEFPEGYAQNAPATAAWRRAVDAGAFATHRGHVFRGEDRVRKAAIERLMCDFALDLGDPRLGAGAEAALRPAAEGAARRWPGFAALEGSRLRITEEGRPLTRIIARAFDEYDEAGSAYSMAI